MNNSPVWSFSKDATPAHCPGYGVGHLINRFLPRRDMPIMAHNLTLLCDGTTRYLRGIPCRHAPYVQWFLKPLICKPLLFRLGCATAQFVQWLGCGKDGPVFESLQRRDIFLLLQNVQTRSGAHPASNGHRGSLPGMKKPGCDVEHTPPYRAEAKNEWRYTSTPPHTPSFVGRNFAIFMHTFTSPSIKFLQTIVELISYLSEYIVSIMNIPVLRENNQR